MIERGIKIRHLRCFREVVRLGSVKRAAEVLSISQPAVSKTLSDLEALFGVVLLNRSRSGITPTSAGAKFSEHVEETLSSLRRCMESVGSENGQQKETIRVGILPAAGARLIPEAVRLFTLEHPQHHLRLIAAPTPDLIERLRLGELDFVVGHLSDPSKMSGLSFEYLFSERITLVVRPGHPYLDIDPFDLRLLGRHIVLMPAPDAIIFDDVERFLLSNGIQTLPKKIENASHLFGRTFTRATDAIWIASEGAVATDLLEGTLGRLAIETPDTTTAVGITTRSSTPLTQSIRDFVEVVRAIATQPVA